MTRHKFSEAKFNKTCLAEYAEMYSTVCVDAGSVERPPSEICENPYLFGEQFVGGAQRRLQTHAAMVSAWSNP